MSEAELRAMVREVLREALGKTGRAPQAAARPPEPVRIASDADLAAFVRRLVGMLDDPATGPALRAGRIGFTLAGSTAAASQAKRATAAPASVLEGTVTEARVARLAGAGTVVLAADAVITPLARDRARALGLKIERRH